MSYNVTIFGINLTINPVAFKIPIGENGWSIYWYGILIALGFLLAMIYGMKNASRFGINTDRMLDVVLVVAPVSILCARAYYIIFDPYTKFTEFFDFSNLQGFTGLAIYGAVIGAFLSGFIMCKLRKIKVFDMFDLAAIGFLIGQGIGRWGNFVNQEAYGTFTGSSWFGMQSERTIAEMGSTGLVHPCFLYESVWCIIGFFLLHHFSKKRDFSGEIFLMYGVWYGFGRAFIELLRTDSLMLGAFRVSSLLSFLLCIVCAILLVYFKKRSKALKAESSYGNQFAEQSNEDTEENTIEETNNEQID